MYIVVEENVVAARYAVSSQNFVVDLGLVRSCALVVFKELLERRPRSAFHLSSYDRMAGLYDRRFCKAQCMRSEHGDVDRNVCASKLLELSDGLNILDVLEDDML